MEVTYYYRKRLNLTMIDQLLHHPGCVSRLLYLLLLASGPDTEDAPSLLSRPSHLLHIILGVSETTPIQEGF